jgi:hypothetical protein
VNVIKLFADFDVAKVGQLQSVLEAEGIQTHLKNQFGSTMGEIPFVDVVPELWILNDEDLIKAKKLINKLLADTEDPGPEWTCKKCDSVVDGVFARCWNTLLL